MNGKTIQELRCPYCANRRTVRVGRSNLCLCFNCRFQWRALRAPSDGPATGVLHA